MTAKKYNSGYQFTGDAFNGITCASDGKIYYVLPSNSLDRGGKFLCFDPSLQTIELLGDLTDLCGEQIGESIPQGKTHTDIFEWDRKLYFATHIGFYETINGMERLPVNPPDGFKLYPGSHIICYDIDQKVFERITKIPGGEGVITMVMDETKGDIYLITWPRGNFIHIDVEKNELKNLGAVAGLGESGKPGESFRVLCRCMFIDPRNTTVYFSTAEGDIYFYRKGGEAVQKLEGTNLELDYFGKYDITRPASMGYNWRKITWSPEEQVAYGVHGNSGYLFRFDPVKREIALIDRITSEPSKKSGMFDKFPYGYLGFQLGNDNKTLYYLTGGPVRTDNGFSGSLNGTKENLHLITYDLREKNYIDHGPVYLDDGSIPSGVNSITIDAAGNIYTLARIHKNGKNFVDLVIIPDPFGTLKTGINDIDPEKSKNVESILKLK